MNILVNKILYVVPNNCAITNLLDFLSSDNTRGIAVAVNEKVVPKHEWNGFLLKDNDEVFIIKAIQGG